MDNQLNDFIVNVYNLNNFIHQISLLTILLKIIKDFLIYLFLI